MSHTKALGFLTSAGIVAMLAGSAANAATLIVQKTNMSAYQTIQSAIDAANPGDTIKVYAQGTSTNVGNANLPYVETIDLGTKNLTIIGVPVSGQTYKIWIQPDTDVTAPGIVTIDGEQDSSTVFENFKLQTLGDGVPGRGMYIGPGSSPTINGVLFTGLDAAYGAGVLIEWKGADPLPGPTSPVFTGCEFNDCDAAALTEEQAPGDGGAVYVIGASPVFIGGSLHDCSAINSGGGLYVNSYVPPLPDDPNDPPQPAEVTLRDVSFVSNNAAFGGGLSLNGDTVALLRGTVWGSGGMRFVSNAADAEGGAIHTLHEETGSLEIVRTMFSGNTAGVLGGAIATQAAGPVAMVSVNMQDNKAENTGGFDSFGGAIYHASLPAKAGAPSATCTIVNSRFVGSEATIGAALYTANQNADMLVQCSTIANSVAGGGHSAVFNGFGTMEIMNSIVYWNEPAGSDWVENALPTFPPLAYYSDLQGGNNNAGDIAVFDLDPQFKDKANDDVQLEYTSGCRDQGSNDYVPTDDLDLDESGTIDEILPQDIAGDPRLNGDEEPYMVDMGCYELGPGGPCNIADIAEPYGVLDLQDVGAFIYGFLNQQPEADVAEPFGVWDLQDVNLWIYSFLLGCP